MGCLDNARAVYPLVGYVCKQCENEFFAHDDTAKMCPFCGGRIEVLYDWDVELVDWGKDLWRRL